MVTKLLPPSHYSRYLNTGFKELEDQPKITIYTTKKENEVRLPSTPVKAFWSTNFLYPLQITWQAWKDKPDLVHIQHEFNMFGGFSTALFFPLLLILLRFIVKKIVVTVHAVVPLQMVDNAFVKAFSTNPLISKTLVKLGFKYIFTFTCLLATHIIVHDRCFLQTLISDYGAKPAKISVIPMGIDKPKKFHRGKWSAFLGNRKIILHFGYLSARKGIDFLVEAFHMISSVYPDYDLVLAGGILPYQEDYVENICRIIEDRKLTKRVFLTGFLTEENAFDLINRASLMVFPYIYSISASLPLSFAIQYRKPVIATNIGSFKEELKQKSVGLLVPPKDQKALSEAMQRLISDESLRNTFSANMSELAVQRSWKNVSKETYKIYLRL